ncbi:MAG: geranylgeranylglycerol-phosphate geranylgeranyltransferase [Salibacteraceae bacterium]
MNPVIAFIKASRWQNMLMIALTMILTRVCVIYAFFDILTPGINVPLNRGLSNLDFSLLVVSSMLIAAAGNMINDYFDLKIDRINKPNKIIIGRFIKRRIAMVAHLTLSGIGVAIAAYLSYKIGIIELVFIQLIVVATLWFYSTDFKRRLIWGNLAIAFCVAIIPMVVWLFEILSMIHSNKTLIAEEVEAKAFFMQYAMVTLSWVGGLGAFSFVMTIAREITKDIIDIKGDEAYGCNTLPIKLGIVKSKNIVSAIYLIVLAGTLFVQQVFLPDNLTMSYIVIAIAPFILASLILTFKGKKTADFSTPSLLNKVASLMAVLYLIVVFYILNPSGA